MVWSMTITPAPLPADEVPRESSRVRSVYEWDKIQLGVWQLWVGSIDDEGRLIPADVDDDEEAMRQCTRVRVAAKWHADTNGLVMQSERSHRGRVLKLRFTHRQP